MSAAPMTPPPPSGSAMRQQMVQQAAEQARVARRRQRDIITEFRQLARTIADMETVQFALGGEVEAVPLEIHDRDAVAAYSSLVARAAESNGGAS